MPDALAAFPPFVSMELRKDDVSMSFFSTITKFATARDVMLQDLKIECFFDFADENIEVRSKRLAKGQAVTVRGEYGGEPGQETHQRRGHRQGAGGHGRHRQHQVAEGPP